MYIEKVHEEWTITALEEKFYQTEKYFTPLHLFRSTASRP